MNHSLPGRQSEAAHVIINPPRLRLPAHNADRASPIYAAAAMDEPIQRRLTFESIASVVIRK